MCHGSEEVDFGDFLFFASVCAFFLASRQYTGCSYYYLTNYRILTNILINLRFIQNLATDSLQCCF
jgi:hypothetical protein